MPNPRDDLRALIATAREKVQRLERELADAEEELYALLASAERGADAPPA